MPATPSHPPGSFCWIELATTDAAAARDFYTRLFDWGVREVPMGEHGTYFILQKEGRDTGALYQMGPDMQDVPPNWLSYVAVENVDAAAEKIQSLGGKVHLAPMDVFDFGRMLIAVDPQDAIFAVWQAKAHHGIGVRDEANALCWNELQARDVDAAKAFYPALFGWRMKESPEYTEWHLGENAVGGMLPVPMPQIPPHWLPYFAVDDCDAAVQRAASLGAATLVPPTDIEHVGRFAVLADPQGAAFAVIRLSF